MNEFSMNYGQRLRTKVFESRTDKDHLMHQRMMRISEAISWQKGPSRELPNKYVVNELEKGYQVYFLKPGKEAFRKTPNEHDMLPCIGNSYLKSNFNDIWVRLSRVSIIDRVVFNAILVMIYRNAYHMDHVDSQGAIRYRPSLDKVDLMKRMDSKVSHLFEEGGILGFMNFLDILGWNEDVKYHSENGRPTFAGKYQFETGRINTLLTCIKVPYLMADFINEVIEHHDSPKDVDLNMGFSLMQQFARTRGTCTPSKKDLRIWFNNYLY